MKTERRSSKRGSVLVVDDEEIMREVLETLLTAEGYRVDLAKTGEEGLEAYGRRTFDVVLLDVSMPGIGGLRALEEFLKMDSDAVIVMSSAQKYFVHPNSYDEWLVKESWERRLDKGFTTGQKMRKTETAPVRLES